jgi:hypothetical protein
MPCTWQFLQDWDLCLAEWTEYRICKAAAYLIAIGLHKPCGKEFGSTLFIIGTRRERRASQDAQPSGKKVQDNLTIAQKAQEHMYEDAAPLRRSGQGEDTVYADVCPTCGEVLDPHAFIDACRGCGWDELIPIVT